jgi:hypothetical protein
MPTEVRRIMNFKRLALTDYKIDIPRLARKKVLIEKLAAHGERGNGVQSNSKAALCSTHTLYLVVELESHCFHFVVYLSFKFFRNVGSYCRLDAVPLQS